MIPDDGLGSASKEDGEEQEMEERHWEDLWHLELDNMEDSPILEMGVKPLKTQCHQQAPETGSNISRRKMYILGIGKVIIKINERCLLYFSIKNLG